MNKKAVSIMIGYILLVTAVVIMGVLVAQWIKSYVPGKSLECPDDTSAFIKNYSCDSSELQITLKNNGKFNLAGYFIRVTDSPEQELATIDLSSRILEGGVKEGNSILFEEGEENTLGPNSETTQKFDLTEISPIYLVEITPVRYQEEDNKIRFVNCGNAKVRENVNCQT